MTPCSLVFLLNMLLPSLWQQSFIVLAQGSRCLRNVGTHFNKVLVRIWLAWRRLEFVCNLSLREDALPSKLREQQTGERIKDLEIDQAHWRRLFIIVVGPPLSIEVSHYSGATESGSFLVGSQSLPLRSDLHNQIQASNHLYCRIPACCSTCSNKEIFLPCYHQIVQLSIHTTTRIGGPRDLGSVPDRINKFFLSYKRSGPALGSTKPHI